MTARATLTLNVGGIGMAVTAPAAWRPRLTERYGQFLSNDRAAWQVTVQHGWTAPQTQPTTIEHGETWTRFAYAPFGGWLDLAGRQAGVAIASDQHLLPALERLLVYLLTQALPQDVGGLLLHACGVVRQGQAHVFIGPSGAGKSTIARLASGYGQVLCDENIVLRLGAAGPEALSTPFWGQATPDTTARLRLSAPLAALYTLQQTPDFSLAPLTPAQAVLALIDSTRIAVEQPSRAAAWLAAAQSLLAQAPIYRLGFQPTTDLWPFLAGPHDAAETLCSPWP